MNSFLTFDINEQTLAVDMLNVERIIKLPEISPVPNSPEYYEGVIDVQNLLIAAINLKKKFNFSEKEVLKGSGVVIITNNNEKSGIIVDYVNDIIEIDEKDILKTQSNKYIYGVVKVNNNFINLLDSRALILD